MRRKNKLKKRLARFNLESDVVRREIAKKAELESLEKKIATTQSILSQMDDEMDDVTNQISEKTSEFEKAKVGDILFMNSLVAAGP